jgi:acyl carrier protein
MTIFYEWLLVELKDLIPDVTIDSLKNTPIAAIGLDSLELLDLIMKIEDEFGVEIEIENVDKAITISQLAKLIES